MTKIIITRQQFEQIKAIFDEYDIDQLLWTEESKSGIGPTVHIEFEPVQKIKMDITDVTTW